MQPRDAGGGDGGGSTREEKVGYLWINVDFDMGFWRKCLSVSPKLYLVTSATAYILNALLRYVFR